MKNKLTLLCLLISSALFSQLITPFTIRYQTTQKGGITYLSNTAVTCNGGFGCGTAQSQIPPAGNGYDNNFTEAYVDIDGDGSTFQSSSDSLALSTCSEILWAGLYWGGEITSAAADYATRDQVKIKVNNGAYTNLTASSLQDNTVGFNTYHCFKDITTIVQAAGVNARFTVANVAVRVGGSNRFGGWSIVVVYKNDLMPMRNLTVFNGLSNVSTSNVNTDITVSGFLTPQSGPVTFEIGQVTYDGDRSLTGDQLLFNGGSGFVNITDAANPTNDIFNSTLTYNGVPKNTPFIIPAYQNTLGYDADIFVPNNASFNYIGNSATSATLRLTTQNPGGETYLTQVVTMAIDVYEPDLRAAVRAVDLNGGLVQPGDTIEYTIVGKNIGSDPSVNTFITDTIEPNAIYVPGSLRITSGPNSGNKTDATADDQGEYIAAQRLIKVRIGTGANGTTGGTVVNSPAGIDSTQIKFRVTATTDCIILLCDNVVNARAYIFGTGNVSGNTWTNGSNPDIFDTFGCPIPGTTTTPIQAATCAAVTASSNSPVCTGGTINLSLSATSSNATYSWTGPNSFSSTAASPSITGATAAMAGTYTCVVTVGIYACSYTITTTVAINAAPTTSNAGPDQTICTTTGSVTLAGNNPSVGTGTWTFISGPSTPTITNPALRNTTVTGLTSAGTYILQWTITSSCATGSSDQVSIIVNAPPTTSNAGPDASVCGLTATLAGNAAASGTGTWTQTAGPGTSLFVNANLATTNVTVSTAGAYTFRWTIANAPCTASQDNVIITFVSSPTTSNAGPDQTICSTAGSATMAANAAATGTGAWTQVSGPVSATITTPASASTTITGMTTAGTYVFQWTISNAPCTPSTDQVSVFVNAPPTTANAGPDQTVCAASATMAGNTATTGTGAWTQISGPNSATITTASSPTTTMTGLIAGTYVFQWTITNAPCAASSDQVQVIVNAAAPVANAGPDQNLCSVTSATMAGNVATPGTGTWTQISGPNSATITTPSSPTSTMTGLIAGTYVFQWTIAHAPCASTNDQVTVVISATPTTANAGPDQNSCGTTVTMAGNTPATGTGAWTQISGPNSATITTASSPTTTMTGLTAGSYVFQWTISNGACAPSTDQVTVVVSATPTTANAGADQTICATSGSATMAGNTAVVGTGAWTQISGPVTATITTPSSATSTITGMTTAGTYVFQWTITNGSCPSSSDQVSIFVNDAPTPANAGPDQSLCAATSATMAGNTAVVGAGAWTQISGPNSATITTPASATTTMTGLVAGTYVFQWTISNAPCAASSDQVTVVINPVPTTANAGADQTVCNTNSVSMAGNTPVSGTGLWSQVSGPNSATITTPASATTTMTGLTPGTYVFVWTISSGSCTASTDTVNITIDPLPTTANAGPDQLSVCPPFAVMAANTASVGTGTWTQISGPNTATIVNANSETTSISNLVQGTYVFEWTISSGSCAVSSDQVTITVVNCDHDGDGIVDSLDPDDDNDGILDVVEGTGDTDGDGIPDYLDLDSDNDGIPDVIESGGSDPDGDGIIGVGPIVDTDGDGLSDIVDTDNGGTPLATIDTDGDGIPNQLDLDSDNDGITDVTEAGGTDANGDGIIDGFTDANGNGFADNVDTSTGGTSLPTLDSDGDGLANYIDLDSDNDGIPDVTEAGGIDANGDGIIDGYTDTDNDGLSDNVDTNNGGTMLSVPDTDGDGLANYLDLDSDNDGITDVTEAGGIDANGDGIIDGFTDTDNDGLSDNVDTNNGGTMLPVPDTDGDGHANYLDLDSDNDGITDVTEAGGIDANGDGIIDGFTDANGNGLSDNVDPSASGTPLVIADLDGDGLANYIDLDSDNDGIADVIEAGGTDTNGDGIIDGYSDTDNDGLSDNVDTNNGGTMLPVPDTDGDGHSNYVDLDSDNDGITDVAENGGADANGDGFIDGFTDTDNDGLSDNVDANNGGTTLAVLDNDGDGHPNYLDLDSDNDGITDIIEVGGTDADGNGQVDGSTDTDNDGLNDSVDPTASGTAIFTTGADVNNDGRPDSYPNDNFDNAGGPNFLDIDSDDDGIVDNIEGQPSATYVAPTGNDTDGDGIDDAYDTFNGFGGAGVSPVNTDNASDGPDYLDLDSDNDSFADAIEGWDTNNDGIADTNPSGNDIDGDGLDDAYDTNTALWNPTNGQAPTFFPNLDNPATPELDWRESDDHDGDGIVDALDLDDDNDGIPDTVEGNGDTDGDGIPDYLDLDSDNDGIPDVIESGGSDPDGDGIIGTGPIVDTDGDGLSDLVDPDNGGTPLTIIDTDGDGIPNQLDLDSDNDGITDVTEAGGTDANGDGIIDGYTDTDGNGFSDNVDSSTGGTPLPTLDTDGDGQPNYADLDSDNDGTGDVTEAGGVDANGDGIIDGYTDTDGDGLSDNVDTNNGGTMLAVPDTDGDGAPNYLDLDSDNDGISDLSENGYSALDANNDGIIDGTDTDGDGIINVAPIDSNSSFGGTGVSSTPDTDGDNVPNYLDLDSDNDGISDVSESGHGALDANNDGVVDGTDTDNDGVINVAGIDNNSTFGGNNLNAPDFDGDGIANQNDPDSDNDGITDIVESGNAALDANNDGIIDGTDADGDGMLSSIDNNSTFGGQPTNALNSDGTGGPDYLDIDSDDDGIVDNVEAQSTLGYLPPSGIDSDGDGLDDVYDTFTGFGGSGLTPVNTDGTDEPDYLDLDSDNDLVSDLVEGWDTDGNGTAETVPSGSDLDNDGLDDAFDVDDALVNPTNSTTPLSYPDVVNPGGDRDWRDKNDHDGDGIVDAIDIDDDNDGILDTDETGADFDGDGIPNWFDLDSDNDGIPDVVEGGSPDVDGDGIVDNFTDLNNDGYDDFVASSSGTAGPAVTDFDGDGHPDYLDLDSDNDGIADVIEGGSPDADGDGMVDNFTDADHDGFADGVENGTGYAGPAVPDSDGDGLPDYHDLDSDNDGIPDVIEGGSPDVNGDGLVDNFTDTNNNGWSDTVENASGNAGPAVPDTDGDGHPDYLDLDSDNDGIADVTEGGSPDTNGDGLVDNFTDANGDGFDDTVQSGTGNAGPAVGDWDGDGIPDYLDLDSDNDGIADVMEGGSPDVNGDGMVDNFTDANGDGFDDTVVASNGNAGPAVPDTDGDGHPDYLDLDSDNDGIADVIEGGSPDVNGDGVVDNFTDLNGDGWDDTVENGSGTAGPGVGDWDGDGHPDYLDLDSDNDGIPDIIEGGSPDADGNGMVDNFTDTDGDGWDDNVENGSGNAGPSVPDSDGDGHPDYLDLDSDNDGIPDIIEGGSPDVNGDGMVDNFTDSNGNGWDDTVENGNGSAGPGVPDTDGDGTPDYLDLDSDNDGITDAIEGGGQDADGDGIIDNFTDSNGDGWDDNTQNGTGDAGPGVPDTDGDGIPNYLDLDSDGDGNLDGQGEEVPTQDCDGDGISNYIDPDPCGLDIPQGFSPNGDGINDIFEIKGISAYPDNKVTIFNRWGNLVYEAAGYDNGTVSWDGTNSGSLSTGSGQVPEGTYFYVIDLGDGSPVLSGYIFVNRQ